MSGVFISRVQIKNFRNFKSIDVRTSEKQVLFGENESGKSNYLFALQLILDPSLSDQDRQLSMSDFNDSIVDPAGSREQIQISIEVDGFRTSRTILAQLSDALVPSPSGHVIRITYRYYPNELEDGSIEYIHSVTKGDKEDQLFTSRDRQFLQLKVIKPLRDVEYELRNTRTSPLTKLLERYEIDATILETIVSSMATESAKLLGLDEFADLQDLIQKRLAPFLNRPVTTEVSFAMAEIDVSRVVAAIRLILSGRSLDDTSLGLKNVLYIVLLLLQFYPGRVPRLLKERDFTRLIEVDPEGLLVRTYTKSANGNYRLEDPAANIDLLTKFFDEHQPIGRPEVIVAIEEPEAHLHPMLQRLVFKDVVSRGTSSVILTTHSPHITSITPLEYMVHLLKVSNGESIVNSASALAISDQHKLDISRYLDVSRGEIYFGRKVLLVEGIAEQFLVPRFAELMEVPLDRHGVVVCNINSTNFVPFTSYLRVLSIPHAVLTDGDYFQIDQEGERVYHKIKGASPIPGEGFLGIESALKHLQDLGATIPAGASPDAIRVLAEAHNMFVGVQTLEVDIMQASHGKPQAEAAIVASYEQVCQGGQRQRAHFRTELENGDFDKCLSKIEDAGVGKGRFSQSLVALCVLENVPVYVRRAIRRVIEM